MITFKEFVEFSENPENIGASEYIKKEEKKYYSVMETKIETLEDGSERQVDTQVKKGEREEVVTTVYKYTLRENGVIEKQLASPEELQKVLDAKQAELTKIQEELGIVQSL